MPIRSAHDLGISSNGFFAAFSAAMIIGGLLGPHVGRQIDLLAGRPVLSGSNVILAAGLALPGASTLGWMLGAAWFLLGIDMAMGLYDAAFSALGRIYGDNARRAITGIALVAGFASTVGWPLSSWGLETIGLTAAKRAERSTVKPHIQIDRPMNLRQEKQVERKPNQKVRGGPSVTCVSPWHSQRLGPSRRRWQRTCRASSRCSG